MLHMTDERHDLGIQLGGKVMPIVMSLALTRQHDSPNLAETPLRHRITAFLES